MDRKIRVLHAITNMQIGGAENLVKNILLGLDRTRFEPYLFIFEEKGEFLDDIKKQGIRVFSSPIRVRRFDPFLLWKIAGILKSNKIDIVHTHLYQSSSYVRLAAILARVPVILYHEHGSIRPHFFRYRMIAFLLVRWTDKIVAISRSDIDYYSKNEHIGQSRFFLLPNALLTNDDESYQAADAEKYAEILKDKKVIGCVANFSKIKGHKYLLMAFAWLIKEYPRTILILVGDGPEKESLVELARQLKINEKILFSGRQKNVGQWYRIFNYFVLPSVEEGFGLVLLEAAKYGIPIVATRAGGIPEILTDGETGLLVPPKDPESIFLALKRLFSDNDLAGKIGEKGKEMVLKKYDFKNYIKTLEGLYTGLWEQKRRRE